MNVVNVTGHGACIVLSKHEIAMIGHAINAVCNELDELEFSTRMGADRDKVSSLLESLNAMSSV